MIAIRTDANTEIATGHVMRCITLGKALELCGKNVIFITTENDCKEIILENGFRVIKIHGKWNNLSYELEDMKYLVNENKITTLIVDSYFANNIYLSELSKLVSVAYFDDLFKEKYNVDFIINYNAFYSVFDYAGRYGKTRTQCLLGVSYVPLRKEFRNYRKKNIGKVSRLVFICGGGDKHNTIGKQITYFENSPYFNQYEYWIILGKLNKNEEELRSFEEKYSNVRIYKDVSNMAEIMSKCDLAISAASTVLYELCAIGLPTIFYEVSKDQEMDKLFFQENDLMMYAGNASSNLDACLSQILQWVIKITNDYNKLEYYNEKMRSVVDGKGASRIAQCLIKEK